MNKRQIALLVDVENGPRFVRAGRVRTAQAMQLREFVSITDDGRMRGNNAERWTVSITDRGRLRLKALRAFGKVPQ